MKLPTNYLAWANFALTAPAFLFCTAGILYVGFGLEGANRMLETMMADKLLKLLTTPVVVLGGPALVIILNGWRVFHVSADIVNEQFIVAFSIKRLFGHLFWVGLAGCLLLLLLSYAFVENFQIVAR